MAHLIHMRQRIKAIETIKKITHAMRLISMSNHARFKNKDASLKTYTQALNKLFHIVKKHAPSWHNEIVYPHGNHKKTLIVLVGSQKGLCGTFNSALFKMFQAYMTKHPVHNPHYIAVGKRAVDFITSYTAAHPGTLVALYPEFSGTTLSTLIAKIAHEIIESNRGYTHVLIASNKPKTFFVQKAEITLLIPFATHAEQAADNNHEYDWQQSPETLLDTLVHQCITASLQTLLFQSLLAEHAARFLSMDTSTRNAETLLEETELLYNKLRQAKITKELTELTGTI
jgi:F-type H+-transporting ATPase subunit gamma